MAGKIGLGEIIQILHTIGEICDKCLADIENAYFNNPLAETDIRLQIWENIKGDFIRTITLLRYAETCTISKYPKDEKQANIEMKELISFIIKSAFFSVYAQMEIFIRAIREAEGHSDNDISQLEDAFFSYAQDLDIKKAWEVIKYTRNTLHYAGIYKGGKSPKKQINTTLEYKGKKYEFQIGKKVVIWIDYFADLFIPLINAFRDVALHASIKKYSQIDYPQSI